MGLARLKAGYLLMNDKPRDAKYITDNDLLPKQHPKSTKLVITRFDDELVDETALHCQNNDRSVNILH